MSVFENNRICIILLQDLIKRSLYHSRVEMFLHYLSDIKMSLQIFEVFRWKGFIYYSKNLLFYFILISVLWGHIIQCIYLFLHYLQGISKNWMLTKNIETSLIFSSFNSMICDHIVPFIFSYNIWEPIQKMECMLETWKQPFIFYLFLGWSSLRWFI